MEVSNLRVSLNGIVASDDDVGIYEYFGWRAFGPQRVRDAISGTSPGDELIFEINSPGGSVMAGSEIYSVLRGAENVHTRAEIQSMAASAASYLCLGCDEVMISPVAQMMIHLPATITDGDRTDHLRSVQMLDATRDAILNAYQLKSAGKADRSEFRRLMNAETWLTAQDAVALGLADGILYADDGAWPQDIVNAVGTGIRALGAGRGMPDIAAMRAEYRENNKQKPKDSLEDWRENARLELERLRFLQLEEQK